MLSIAAGFCTIFLVSYWICARVGARRQSSGFGMAAGVISYLVLLCGYIVALAFWARAKLVSFLKAELPMLIDRVMDVVDRVTLFRDTI